MKIVALMLAVLASAPAWADVVMDPGDDKWAKPLPEKGDKGKVTVQGDEPSESRDFDPPVPYPVSVAATLVAEAGGFVLLIPQLSTNHVLGFRTGANRVLGYLGLGTLTLSCTLGMGLSGGGVGTMVVAPVIESALIGAGFGLAFLANMALHAPESNTVGKIAVNDVAGIPLEVISVPFIAFAAIFPIFCALVPGGDLDGNGEKELRPVDSVGFLPLKGGGVLTVGLGISL